MLLIKSLVEGKVMIKAFGHATLVLNKNGDQLQLSPEKVKPYMESINNCINVGFIRVEKVKVAPKSKADQEAEQKAKQEAEKRVAEEAKKLAEQAKAEEEAKAKAEQAAAEKARLEAEQKAKQEAEKSQNSEDPGAKDTKENVEKPTPAPTGRGRRAAKPTE